MSRVAEEFHCLPSVAVRALENDPDRLIMTILMLRAFASAKDVYDHSKDKKNLPQSKMMELVQEIEFEAIRESMK